MAYQKRISNLENNLQLPQKPLEQQARLKSIYRVPKIFTDVNRQAYQPKLASFGPYHHNCSKLLSMEKHKERALMQFLRRISLASKTFNDVLVAMREVEPSLIASYKCLQVEEDDEGVERGRFHPHDWLKEKDEFVLLMIVDGCFALEIMLADKRFTAGEQSEYDSYDPVFGAERKNYIILNLKRDMLLLENQLPLLALTTLATIDGSRIGDLKTLIKDFYKLPSTSREDGIIDAGSKGPAEQCVHILDMYKKTLTSKGDYMPNMEEEVQSATKLKNAGVSFCKSNNKAFKDISFKGGVLYLPQLKIDDTTESLLLNLMAFESLHRNAGNAVTAYVFFMNDLIRTADDVALLRAKNIIMGSYDKHIANIFKTIVKEVILTVSTDNIQVDVKRKLNTYCKNRFYRRRAIFCYV